MLLELTSQLSNLLIQVLFLFSLLGINLGNLLLQGHGLFDVFHGLLLGFGGEIGDLLREALDLGI